MLAGLTKVDAAVEISGLALDSRQVEPGFAFFALSGSTQHGMVHLRQAINNGAAAVIFDPAGGGRDYAEEMKTPVLIELPNLAECLGQIAARFYRDPSQFMAVIGVTGTNGKTTCSQFLAQALPDCGVIGTMGWGSWGELKTTVNTTPDALAIQGMLSELRREQKKHVAMEVSSHGLEQGRVNGVCFKGALFTNLSRDHLDYHGSMANYLAAKKKLFSWPGLEFAAVNLDDLNAEALLDGIPETVKVWGYTQKGCDGSVAERVYAENIEHELNGITFEYRWQNRRYQVRTPIAGVFNMENVLAVLTVMLAMGVSPEEVAKRLKDLKPVTGRMENFGGRNRPTVFVDYAHSPDAVDKVLAGLKPHCRGELKVVFGCGGDRDRGKRAEMGAAAEKWADKVFVTDDNPRSENPEQIVDDILKGCHSGKVTVIHDRRLAIRTAIDNAQRLDCIVIAGKGHERYQEIGGIRTPFSDQQVVREVLAQWCVGNDENEAQ